MPGVANGTQIGTTTLAAAVTSSSQNAINLTTLSITVGPYTTVTAKNPQWALFIDNEIMMISSIGASTTVFVERGQAGTQATTHANGQTVWAAPANFIPLIGPSFGPGYPFKFRVQTVPIGSVAYGSFGNATTNVAGTILLSDLYVPNGFVATGIAVLNGGTVGTDKGLVALYDFAGNLVASSALAGATTAGANAFQTRAFSLNPAWLNPGKYWVAYQANGTTDNVRTVAASTFIDVLATSQTGTFGTVPTPITLPTTFTANVGPIAYIY